MKELLETIWNDKKCRCPCHVTWWHIEEFGHNESTWINSLWWSKGLKLNPKKR